MTGHTVFTPARTDGGSNELQVLEREKDRGSIGVGAEGEGEWDARH